MKLILKNGLSVLYKDGMGLTGMNIVSIVADSKEDRFNLRMLLIGGLKVGATGCHSMGCDFGQKALNQNPDASNGSVALGMTPNGSNALADSNPPKSIPELDYSLEEKLRIIDTLSSAIQRNEPIMYPHTQKAEEKLLALIQSI